MPLTATASGALLIPYFGGAGVALAEEGDGFAPVACTVAGVVRFFLGFFAGVGAVQLDAAGVVFSAVFAADIASTLARRSLSCFSCARAWSCKPSSRARRAFCKPVRASSNCPSWSPGDETLAASTTRNSTSYRASTLRVTGSTLLIDPGAASAAASNGGKLVCTSRRMALMLVPASSRTVPLFHLSSFIAVMVCCTVSSEGCSNPDGAAGTAGAVGEACAGVPVSGDCAVELTANEQRMVRMKVTFARRIGSFLLLL
jgi:hypothetical protein